MYFFPQINFRKKPEGLCRAQLDGKKPNWVSSLVSREDPHYIEPYSPVNLAQLAACLQQQFQNITVVQVDSEKLIGYRQTKLLNFVDWFCIQSNGEISSTATMGYSDLGKNRELIEHIRQICL